MPIPRGTVRLRGPRLGQFACDIIGCFDRGAWVESNSVHQPQEYG